MNIFALNGHKVKVTEQSAKNGYDYNSEQIRKCLTIGEIYTIEKTIVMPSSTTIYLQEYPDTPFNSVNFEDVREQSKEEDKKHNDYPMYFPSHPKRAVL